MRAIKRQWCAHVGAEAIQELGRTINVRPRLPADTPRRFAVRIRQRTAKILAIDGVIQLRLECHLLRVDNREVWPLDMVGILGQNATVHDRDFIRAWSAADDTQIHLLKGDLKIEDAAYPITGVAIEP